MDRPGTPTLLRHVDPKGEAKMAKVASLAFVAVAIAATWSATIDAQSRAYTNADLRKPLDWAPKPRPAELESLKARQFPTQISAPDVSVANDWGPRFSEVSHSWNQWNPGWERFLYPDAFDAGWPMQPIQPYGLFHACLSAAIAARVPMDHVYVRGFQCPCSVDWHAARAGRIYDRR
jgi:hypothetical protein